MVKMHDRNKVYRELALILVEKEGTESQNIGFISQRTGLSEFLVKEVIYGLRDALRLEAEAVARVKKCAKTKKARSVRIAPFNLVILLF